MAKEKRYSRVLTVAGSDSGGGAGIQADLKTIAANGCYGMSVITALTAQNTLGVSGIHVVPVDFVQVQLDAVLSDIGCDAVKIGMLFSAEQIRAVAEGLQRHGVQRIVLDPVMAAQSGEKLVQDEAIVALRKHLIPLADLITPNLPEASVLLGLEIRTSAEIHEAAVELAGLGCGAVLIKGGHLESGDCDDCLYLAGEKRTVVLPGRRVATTNNHGTGCTLSSAIAANMAKGLEVEAAVRSAKEYITAAIVAGSAYKIGKGHGPVHHFHPFW
ncbi:MAG: bifunctional hydroxymethylpyrimidine kinase/phosphomethylpyrimidine kinase [Proteobacteria bacterium]|nr:bifunctional hydroxymethylpyrimidine kinase/phosphomethylpyrimidine kinase [Pseudomonadota bacterium]